MNLTLCNRQISPLQRRSIRVFGTCLVLVAVTELIWVDGFAKNKPSIAITALFAALPAILVAAMIVNIGRYLARETDEFIRTLVVVSMLWSFGIIMVVDTVLGVLFRSSAGLHILPMLNIDLFCVVTPLALRIQLWSNR
jgi:hypothetical protein